MVQYLLISIGGHSIELNQNHIMADFVISVNIVMFSNVQFRFLLLFREGRGDVTGGFAGARSS